MSLETRRERIIYLGLVPILGAILGAIATSIFQISNASGTDLPSAMAIMKDQSLTNADKIKLIEMIKDVGDRPWSVIRTLVGSLAVLVGVCAIPISQRIANR